MPKIHLADKTLVYWVLCKVFKTLAINQVYVLLECLSKTPYLFSFVYYYHVKSTGFLEGKLLA